MKIQTTSQNFAGYDARSLKGVLVTDKRCAKALSQIGKNINLEVVLPNIASKSIRKDLYNLTEANKLLWAQDYLTILPQRAILYDDTREYSKRVLRATAEGFQKMFGIKALKSEPHLRGGNFFVCNVDDKKKLLVGANRLIYSEELFKKIFDVDEVHPIPVVDWHLDLFIRPLDNGKVLVADGNETKLYLEKGIEKLKNYIAQEDVSESDKKEAEAVMEQLGLAIQKWEITEEFAPYKPKETMSKIIGALENAGFNPIRVPGAYYYLDGVKNEDKEKDIKNNFMNHANQLIDLSASCPVEVQQKVQEYLTIQAIKLKTDKNLAVDLENFYNNNFVNAIVTKNEKGELIYITNAALLDEELGITPEFEAKTGVSTKNMFIESVRPYIKKENIYFIDKNLTQNLFKKMGGIHCTVAEIL